MSGQLEVRDESAGQQLLKLVSNPFEAAIQVDAFWASLATSIGISILLTLVFSLLRPRHNLVYAPKIKHADAKHAPPAMGRGPFSWIKPVMKTKEDALIDRIGMDAVFFLRFTRMLRNIFCVLGAVGLLVMIPVNVSTGAKGQWFDRSNTFAVMTPLYVYGQGIWAQVVVAYLVNVTVAYFLWANYKQFYRLRRNYFNTPEYQNSLHARSILIRDIPPKLRSDEGILRLTDEVNPTGVLPKPNIGRNVKILPDLIEEHDETVRKLESVLAKYLKDPNRLPVNRPTMKPPRGYKGSAGKIDSISYLTNRIQQLEAQITDVRETVDKRDAVAYGFASWEQISQTHTVAYNARKKKPKGTIIRLAPRPNDLIWKNMTLSKGTRTRKALFNALYITILTILWTPLNAGIAIFLSNLSNLGSVWPRFQQSLVRHRTWWALVQGIASPALTSLVYLILPIIFRRMQIRAGDVTKTSRERHVLRNLYNFFCFNNLIVFSLFSAVWQYITKVINNSENSNVGVWDALKAANIFDAITISLCQISPFWVTWLLQRNLGAAIDLAQLWSLFYVWFARTFLAPTPRQNIEWTAPPAFDYASYYNYFLFYATIALCFSTLQPIILLVTAFYFLIDSVLKKYLLMYVFVTKTESGGQFWRPLFNRLVFATILSDLVIGAVVGARGTWNMVYSMVPLLIFMVAFKVYCSRSFDDEMHYYHRTGMKKDGGESANEVVANAQGINRASHKFRHPVLEQRLITPMVHAKARHVLAQIYSGRLSDAGAINEYTDIAMEPMTQSGKPPQDAPFELVPEGQQDFAFYKNRSDFRDEGGEIYGRPEDLITERSNTPMSFMTSSTVPLQKSFNDTPGYSDSKQPYTDTYNATGPAQPIAPVPRRAVNPANVHPSIRNSMGLTGDQEGDISLHHGPYTEPGDDRTNLLRGANDITTPNGQFMSMDRWQGSQDNSRANTPGYGGGSYDYFRSQNQGYRGT